MVPVGQKAQLGGAAGEAKAGQEMSSGLGWGRRETWGVKVRHVEVRWPRAVQAVEQLEKGGPREACDLGLGGNKLGKKARGSPGWGEGSALEVDVETKE